MPYRVLWAYSKIRDLDLCIAPGMSTDSSYKYVYAFLYDLHVIECDVDDWPMRGELLSHGVWDEN